MNIPMSPFVDLNESAVDEFFSFKEGETLENSSFFEEALDELNLEPTALDDVEKFETQNFLNEVDLGLEESLLDGDLKEILNPEASLKELKNLIDEDFYDDYSNQASNPEMPLKELKLRDEDLNANDLSQAINPGETSTSKIIKSKKNQNQQNKHSKELQAAYQSRIITRSVAKKQRRANQKGTSSKI